LRFNLLPGDAKLVRIVPVETDREHKDALGEKRLAQRHWHPDKFGRFFLSSLKVEQIKPVLVQARVKMENLFLQRQGDFIVYQYKGRPQIQLNLKDGLFYAPSSEIEMFSREAVEQQAHILLDNLKKAGLSEAVIGKTVFGSSARQVLGHLKTYKEDV
jgi:hypothetical protein